MSRAVQSVLYWYAEGVPCAELAAAFRERRRWTGDDPRLLLAEAAASTTGQRFLGGVKPIVERFREAFVATDRIESLADLAAVDLEDDALVAAVGAKRKRHVLLEAAAVLAGRPESEDLGALVAWAETADHYRYDEDPIGEIAGVGPSTFQYLRQLAGVETIRADPAVVRLLDAVADDLESSPLDTASDRRTIASGEWLALESSYSALEIDRLAWWTNTDADDRAAVLEVHGSPADRGSDCE
ncbi:hypothetical protein Htur_1356 [Haloterrigena turkmenica DSM 5511]|uniref:HhH-GPD family protein n=1 Tax=Haloterrigena turkmenica (strain ATCC 51198 / DSM 5511 / JCM 9101 / NCIMB 13204 / VKM B-1734 / 4k) TaxID=543526 RepID=D2RPY5_HALTV|nr:hypothetical protein [Haloterrigena turkmenica]ADB60244.1 hypothetical protein Htur_1356 [Haloterrigena turkmenica DSM 5511]